jgi:hypothetical protein
MLVVSNQRFHADGRLRGSYVYLLMCQDLKHIHVKVGESKQPGDRLRRLMVGCPLDPGLLAVCELPSKRVAQTVEAELHEAFDQWRTHGEWFRFTLEDKPAFNDAWRPVLQRRSTENWPLHWTKMPVKQLLDHAQKRRDVYRARFMQKPMAYRDFDRDSR